MSCIAFVENVRNVYTQYLMLYKTKKIVATNKTKKIVASNETAVKYVAEE